MRPSLCKSVRMEDEDYGGELYEIEFGGAKVLYFDGTAEYRRLEHWGIQLVDIMAARLREAYLSLADVPDLLHPDFPVPIGPGFDYAAASNLFLGRRGSGPLYVAWDTNLLLDYFKFGAKLWHGSSVADVGGTTYDDELEGLQLLIALWVLRDIRFMVLPRSIQDAKVALSQDRRHNRQHAFREFVRAMQLVGDYGGDAEVPSRDGLLVLPDSELERVKNRLPRGDDRELVVGAVRAGAHVFLTRDKGILKRKSGFRPFGLLIASPQDMIEELFACGAYLCFLAPRFAQWPMQDQQRVAHLIKALPDNDRLAPEDRLPSDAHSVIRFLVQRLHDGGHALKIREQ